MISYGRHLIDEKDIQGVIEALRSEWLTTGPLVENFENEINKVTGAQCVAVSSGTAALHCAYYAIDLQPGDEVITPPITFIATQATAAQLGAKIVFADVLFDTANIDPKAAEAAITTKTKAIVAVDYAGHPADLTELRKIADKYKIFLVEDASHSLGSLYKGKTVGSIADITTFSFFPTKNITTAEGGAVATNNSELLTRARRFSRQGLIKDVKEFKVKTEGAWHQEVHKFGLNYRLPDVLCALGISQINKLASFKQERKKIFSRYISNLTDVKYITLPTLKNFVDPMWHFFPLKVGEQTREELFNLLLKSGFRTQVNYFPVHLHPVFSEIENLCGRFPVSELFYAKELSLPIYVGLSQKQVDDISKIIIDFYNT
jgi:dTDP-4-amino-4,6-dideoxygalactose transaminase